MTVARPLAAAVQQAVLAACDIEPLVTKECSPASPATSVLQTRRGQQPAAAKPSSNKKCGGGTRTGGPAGLSMSDRVRDTRSLGHGALCLWRNHRNRPAHKSTAPTRVAAANCHIAIFPLQFCLSLPPPHTPARCSAAEKRVRPLAKHLLRTPLRQREHLHKAAVLARPRRPRRTVSSSGPCPRSTASSTARERTGWPTWTSSPETCRA